MSFCHLPNLSARLPASASGTNLQRPERQAESLRFERMPLGGSVAGRRRSVRSGRRFRDISSQIFFLAKNLQAHFLFEGVRDRYLIFKFQSRGSYGRPPSMAECQSWLSANRETSTGRVTHKLQQFSEFERYARDRACEIRRSLSAIERPALRERSIDVARSQTYCTR
jgi:hypothetical protein